MFKNTLGRAIAAGIGAVALIGVGVSAASAADSVSSGSTFGGTIYLGNGADGTAWTKTTNAFTDQVVAFVNPNDNATTFPIPSGATDGWTFVSPQGSESTVSTWNAKAHQVLTPGGVSDPSIALSSQGTNGNGTPQGIAAVKAAGGDYSLGVAFTKDNGINLVGPVYYIHIHVTASTGAWTYSQVAGSTTTTVTVPSASPQAGSSFSLSTTVATAGSPTVPTGTVNFLAGSTVIGTGTLDATGNVTATIASGLAAGSYQITAAYQGDNQFAASTSAASTLSVVAAPINTSTALTVNPTTGTAGDTITYKAVVTPTTGSTIPTGAVSFSAVAQGTTTPVIPLASNVSVDATGTATATSSALAAGTWTVTAAFAGTGAYQPSTSATQTVTLAAQTAPPATPDAQNVKVAVPAGSLSIITPYTSSNPLDLGTLQLNQANSTFELAAPVEFGSTTDITKSIKIVNSRPDFPKFTAQVASTDFTSGANSFSASTAGLINVTAIPVTGNALDTTKLTVQDVTALSSSAQTFAKYTGATLGTAWIDGKVQIKGVPSSTASGTYTATLTFTAF